MSTCDCEHGICNSYMPNNVKGLQCSKTENTTNENCPCEHYQQRVIVNTVSEPQTPGCCGGENKTIKQNHD